MNEKWMSSPEEARSRLRRTVDEVSRTLFRQRGPMGAPGTRSPSRGLLASFTDLVEQLDLGPEPEVRECPHCRNVCRREATLCGFCWTKLDPPSSAAAA